GSAVRVDQGVRAAHPGDQLLAVLAADAFVAAPIAVGGVACRAVIAAAFSGPLGAEATPLHAMQVLARQAGAELERASFDRTLRESVEQYRDLFDEAPIAYVHEDLDSRFISANRAAMRILGITPEEVVGMRGMSLVPDTPEAQRLVQDAFASIGRGDDTSGVVLELRRKNDGSPVFIQWWSRPAPSGQYTRTMFIDITDRVLLEREQARLHAHNQYLQEEIKADHNFEEIVGQSPALLRVLAAVERVTRTDSTVLVTGETGTGKELVARAIHSASRRSDKPLIKLNCAALPTGLVESELFGHERGAFSGALQRRLGRFELAHGGTIFLDEVGEMPLDAQVKLLRVLQEGELERVGGAQTIKVDVRVVAATNRDLRRAVSAGQFREDLFYRLNVFPVELPPLRERREDIPLLVRFFLGKHASRVDRVMTGIDPETMQRLVAYRWPGNVRELENLVERAMILARGNELVIEPEIFRTAEAAASPAAASGVRDLDSVQREHIEQALRESGGVLEGDRGAAKRLGLHPNTLRGRMKKLGIKR
ncbi:MAG: sigma 54-interacting transcriptional regulator, partial [Myxococcales bacterium]|nr:sigma 54-interacting transcriptional regulator [Myxococcales bacterium]